MSKRSSGQTGAENPATASVEVIPSPSFEEILKSAQSHRSALDIAIADFKADGDEDRIPGIRTEVGALQQAVAEAVYRMLCDISTHENEDGTHSVASEFYGSVEALARHCDYWRQRHESTMTSAYDLRVQLGEKADRLARTGHTLPDDDEARALAAMKRQNTAEARYTFYVTAFAQARALYVLLTGKEPKRFERKGSATGSDLTRPGPKPSTSSAAWRV